VFLHVSWKLEISFIMIHVPSLQAYIQFSLFLVNFLMYTPHLESSWLHPSLPSYIEALIITVEFLFFIVDFQNLHIVSLLRVFPLFSMSAAAYPYFLCQFQSSISHVSFPKWSWPLALSMSFPTSYFHDHHWGLADGRWRAIGWAVAIGG
jgi:hypothetical protein